ncbi:thioesterase family protein [Pseudohoeflea coraliihabitans]|uniref:Thioesterase family protein n=1 Tax=Pseudohoeflea coraliihabitans TaxID=2860393 RepID=A0ABS6WIX6_9HYPH|nr:thioesterase family protein [Pseudohoeflea sp. DP4N28-3]MBW3095893.1 thioesterase family protein [Pseudohoeflea sp. DP4N28-3]
MTTTPFQTPLQELEPGWFDYNGHLNMAYYNVLFDRAVDVFFDALDCGEAYRTAADCSFFTAEIHVSYVRELREGARVRADIRVVDVDEKRLHVFEELYHEDGWLAATSETLLLHVDMQGPKVAPMPEDLHARMAALCRKHAHLPADPRIGRSIAIRRKG